MRYKTRRRLEGACLASALVFVIPLITAIPLVASIALLHHQWWSAIPLMQYWPAYWWGVISIGLGGAAMYIVRRATVLLLAVLD